MGSDANRKTGGFHWRNRKSSPASQISNQTHYIESHLTKDLTSARNRHRPSGNPLTVRGIFQAQAVLVII